MNQFLLSRALARRYVVCLRLAYDDADLALKWKFSSALCQQTRRFVSAPWTSAIILFASYCCPAASQPRSRRHFFRASGLSMILFKCRLVSDVESLLIIRELINISIDSSDGLRFGEVLFSLILSIKHRYRKRITF